MVVSDPADDEPQGWLAAYREAIHDLTSAPGMNFAVRFSLRNRRLERALFITTSEKRIENLKALAGKLLGLNVLSEGSVEFCADREQHDELADSFPTLRYWAQNEAHTINDCRLACNFRLAPYLKRIESKLHSIELTLQTRNVAASECAELKKALGISRADPPFALGKTRQILEGIIGRIYRERQEGQPLKPLFNMIDELTENGKIFPRKIATYLHTLRVLGNLVAHVGAPKNEGKTAAAADYQEVSETDVELSPDDSQSGRMVSV